MSITEFLLARIAEDEPAEQGSVGGLAAPWPEPPEAIREDLHGKWSAREEACYWHGRAVSDAWKAMEIQRIEQTRNARVLAETRVLAECEAKLEIVKLHGPSTDHGGRFDPFCVGCWVASGRTIAQPYPCRTLRILATVYADHEDYDEEWRPDRA